MRQRFVWNDLSRDRGATVAVGLVLVLSAFLMATGSMVMERTIGSVDALFEQAKPPHFLQMHAGDHDPDALADFVAAHPEIDAWLVTNVLGYDSAAMTWERPSTGEQGDFADSLLDNLFTTQNAAFDFLLDETGAAPVPTAGEVYVPVVYQQRYGLEDGDVLHVAADEGAVALTVAGFVRDAQMASSLSASTRFVIADADVDRFAAAGGGAEEIIVEFRLSDPSLANALQRAYEADPAVPKNGQAATYDMIRLINAVSDGLVAVALVFVSLLLIAIALLSVRFVIRGTIESQVRQIGAMKAIGLPDRTITGLYLAKYRVLTIVACLVGGLLATVGARVLTQGVAQNYAAASVTTWSVAAPVLAMLVVYVVVIAICRGVMRRVGRIEVVDALVHGRAGGGRRSAHAEERRARRLRRARVTTWPRGHFNGRLALHDLRAELGQWMLIPIVFAVSAVLVTLPTTLLTTLENPGFATNMGAPAADLRADVQFTDDLEAVRAPLTEQLAADERLTDVLLFAGVLVAVDAADGLETLHVDVGDHDVVPISYATGAAPADGQIALSVLNAERLGVGVGDDLVTHQGAEVSHLTVSGTYQDVSSGGRTAKMSGDTGDLAAGDAPVGDVVSYLIYANTVDGADVTEIAAEYQTSYPSASVIPMSAYVEQTLSYVTDSLRNAAVLALLFGLGVAGLIVGLFVRLRITRERANFGILSAIGFSSAELVAQVRGKTMLMVTAGVLAGAVATATLGEAAVGRLIGLSGVGLTSLNLVENPLLAWLAYPAASIAVGWLVTAGLTQRLRNADTSAWLKGTDAR